MSVVCFRNQFRITEILGNNIDRNLPQTVLIYDVLVPPGGMRVLR